MPPAVAAPESSDSTQVLPVVVATTATQALATMATMILPAIAPELARTLRLDPSLIGYQVSLVYGGAMLSTAFGGSFVQRYGACRTTQAAMALFAVGLALAAVPALPALLLASVILGLGYGFTNPAASHLLVRFTSPLQRNFIFSVKQTGVPLGGMVAALAAPSIALALGWRWAVGLAALLGLALMLLLQARQPIWDSDKEPKAPLSQHPFGGIPLILGRPRLRWLALAALCFAGIQLCVTTFTVTLLVTDVGYDLIEAGVVLSVVQVAGVSGRLLWGWLADRINDSVAVLVLIGAISLLSALATGLISASWPGSLLSLVFLAFGFSAVGWNGVFLAQVAKLSVSSQVGLATGGALFFTFAGVLFGPAAFAVLYKALASYTLTFSLLAAVAAAGIMCLRLARSAAD
jgi:predicted MFS family arabinose efflux permease